MTPTLDDRRRRAAYRAMHRGTKEMDWLLGRYADAHLAAMSDTELAEFERILAISDPDLQGWLMATEAYGDGEFAALIQRIRAFHGLGTLEAGR
jgi:antitoxin CptB